MDKVRYFSQYLPKKFLLRVSVLVLFLTALSGLGLAQANEVDRRQVVRGVAQNYIQVGTEQYQRGYYEAAERSLLRAQDYQEYLTAAERERLSELLKKTHAARSSII